MYVWRSAFHLVQYVVEIGSVLLEQREAGGFIGIRCVHMDGCCGYTMALVGIGRGTFSILHKHSTKVLLNL